MNILRAVFLFGILTLAYCVSDVYQPLNAGPLILGFVGVCFVAGFALKDSDRPSPKATSWRRWRPGAWSR